MRQLSTETLPYGISLRQLTKGTVTPWQFSKGTVSRRISMRQLPNETLPNGISLEQLPKGTVTWRIYTYGSFLKKVSRRISLSFLKKHCPMEYP